jgi:hypothetical protein
MERQEPSIIPTHDGGCQLSNIVMVFCEAKAQTLPPYRTIDHVIDLNPRHKQPHGEIYHLSEVELKTLKAYILRWT